MPVVRARARRRRVVLYALRDAAHAARRRAARGAVERGPRPRSQDQSRLHGGRARARGGRPQPGRGRADSGPAARGGCSQPVATHRWVRRARLPGRRTARRPRARGGRRGGARDPQADEAGAFVRRRSLGTAPAGAGRRDRARRCGYGTRRVAAPGRPLTRSAGRLRAPMDFAPSDRVGALLDRVREFMEEHVDPVEREATEALDREVGPGVPYPEILVDLRERAKAEGLWNLFLPDERYGPGLTNWEYGMLCELMGRSAVAPMVFNCSAPDPGNMEILAEHGTEEQRERWLTPLLEGESRSCFSMTEPETAGSDPTGLATRAQRRVCDRPGPARPGPHPPLHARDRVGGARVRADVPAGARARGVRRLARREAVRPGLSREIAHGDRRPP